MLTLSPGAPRGTGTRLSRAHPDRGGSCRRQAGSPCAPAAARAVAPFSGLLHGLPSRRPRRSTCSWDHGGAGLEATPLSWQESQPPV